MPQGHWNRAPKRAWTAQQRELVYEGIAAGWTLDRIAKRIGRTPVAVKVFCGRNVKCRGTRPLSARAVATMLGIPCQKTVVGWVRAGMLRDGRTAMRAGAYKRHAFTEDDVFAF